MPSVRIWSTTTKLGGARNFRVFFVLVCLACPFVLLIHWSMIEASGTHLIGRVLELESSLISVRSVFMNSSLLSRNGSTSLALVKGFSDQLGTVSNFSRKDPPSSPIDSQLICACQNSVNKTQASCSSDDLDNNTILHCRDVKTQQGFFRIESSVTAPHLSAFVRINVPSD